MALQLHNSLTGTIEPFNPLTPPAVSFYSCGPTVYDYAHIGHARTYVFADVLERVLTVSGFNVKRVMNITDVGHLTSDADTGEDKMEKGAAREKKSVWEVAKFYTEDFFQMLNLLAIQKPATITRATDYILQMIKMISRLEEKGVTYDISDGIYFDTHAISDYGKLTRHSLLQLEKGNRAGARVEVVKGKKHPLDFALWKRTPKGVKRQMEWDSPWGIGFPGWHIECSAMSLSTLGETIDIHTGGVDHIPIHHTNEIAQSETVTGKPFVRFWLHGEHLLINGEKMSKSLENFLKLTDITQKGFEPLELRYLFYSASYRAQLNFTWDSLRGAATSLKNLRGLFLSDARSSNNKQTKKPEEYKKEFLESMQNDLNTSKALSVVWEAGRSALDHDQKIKLAVFFDAVLALNLIAHTQSNVKIPQTVKALVEKREQLRIQKKFKEADDIRKQIEEKGYTIEDLKKGTKLLPIYGKRTGN